MVNDSPLPAAQDSQPLGVAHTQPTQHAGPGVRAEGRIPAASKVACSGQEAAGVGGAERGTTTQGHRWDPGPRREHTEAAAEVRVDRPSCGGGGGHKSTHPPSAAHGGRSDCRCPLLRRGRQAQDKAHDKGTGPRGPVMAVPGQQTPCVKAGRCVKHSCKVKNKT